jgi:hypothetical protein
MRVEPRLSLSPAPTAVIPPLREKSKNQAPRNGVAQEAGSLGVVHRHQPSCTILLLNAPLGGSSKGPVQNGGSPRRRLWARACSSRALSHCRLRRE